MTWQHYNTATPQRPQLGSRSVIKHFTQFIVQVHILNIDIIIITIITIIINLINSNKRA